MVDRVSKAVPSLHRAFKATPSRYHQSTNHKSETKLSCTAATKDGHYGKLADDPSGRGSRRRAAARRRRRPGRRAELRLPAKLLLQQVWLLRPDHRVLRRWVPVGPVHTGRGRGQRRHRRVLQRHQEPGRGRVRGQELLHAGRVPERPELLLWIRARRLRGRGQARDRRLLRARHARDRAFLLHQRDQQERRLLRPRPEVQPVAVRGGEEVLRARPAAAVVELQLRGSREGQQLRRAREPGRDRAGPRDRVQGGALVLDEQRARGDAAGVWRHHQGHQRQPRVRRQEHRQNEREGGILQAVLPAARRRPRGQPHLLEVVVGFMDSCLA